MKLNPTPMFIGERDRYMVFEIVSKKEFPLASIVKTFWGAILQLYGEAGTASMSVRIPSNLYDRSQRKGIISCNHESVEMVRAAIASIRQIDGENVIVMTLGVSGTMKSAKQKFLRVVDLTSFGPGEKS